jgi:hypothetical protein
LGSSFKNVHGAIQKQCHAIGTTITKSHEESIEKSKTCRKKSVLPVGRVQGSAKAGGGKGWAGVVGVVAMGEGWAGATERGFRLDFAGAKTNRRLFRAAASRPVTDGHESSPDRPQSGIIEKSGGYFCEEPRQNLNESLYTMSCGRRARGGRLREGP